MQIIAVGTNHKLAPIEVREKIAFEPGQEAQFLDMLLEEECVNEAVVLSTCNRTEVYALITGNACGKLILEKLLSFHGLEGADPNDFVYEFLNADAVKHLFEVASSLDSLVVGESQILSQVKSAYELARSRGATGATFNRLFQKAFKVAKQVRSAT